MDPSAPPTALVTTPNDKGILLVVLCFVFLSIASLAVTLRIYARRYKRAELRADDYWIVIALVFLYGNGLSEIVGVFVAGRGHHTSDLPIIQRQQAFQTLLAAEISWALATSATKISLTLLYVRIFHSKREFRFLSYGLLAVVALYCVGTTIYFLTNCRPFAAHWDKTIQNACGDPHSGWLGTGIANIITDVLVLSLPMPSVWQLQLPKKTKLAVVAVFGMGFVVVVISIVRLTSIMSIVLLDFTYSSLNADIFSLLEPTLMITCACLPIMRPLFRKLLPSMVHRSSRNARSAGGGGSNLLSGKGQVPHRLSNIPDDGFRRLDDGDDRKDRSVALVELPRKSRERTMEEDEERAVGGIQVRTEWRVETL